MCGTRCKMQTYACRACLLPPDEGARQRDPHALNQVPGHMQHRPPAPRHANPPLSLYDIGHCS